MRAAPWLLGTTQSKPNMDSSWVARSVLIACQTQANHFQVVFHFKISILPCTKTPKLLLLRKIYVACKVIHKMKIEVGLTRQSFQGLLSADLQTKTADIAQYSECL